VRLSWSRPDADKTLSFAGGGEKAQPYWLNSNHCWILKHVSAEEAQAEQIRTTAPLGLLLQPHAELGPTRRSPRTTRTPEEQHAQLHAQ
jgi:hypothetical protein